MTSKDAHYSLKKAAFLLGVGSSNVYLINVDEAGRMDLDHLRQEIQRAHRENAKPIMISATAGKFLFCSLVLLRLTFFLLIIGTTVLGSIDPLDGVADICQEFGIWMHVDAAWGGGILMSNKYRTLLKGIERWSSSQFWSFLLSVTTKTLFQGWFCDVEPPQVAGRSSTMLHLPGAGCQHTGRSQFGSSHVPLPERQVLWF